MAAHCLRGQVRLHLKDYNGALNDLNFTLKYWPDDFLTLGLRVSAKYSLNDKAGACADYKKYLQLGGKPISEADNLCK